MSMDKLRTYYFGLYGENGITQFFFDQLIRAEDSGRARADDDHVKMFSGFHITSLLSGEWIISVHIISILPWKFQRCKQTAADQYRVI